jgi:predicted DsbA family dithiol-disulfide isomerase
LRLDGGSGHAAIVRDGARERHRKPGRADRVGAVNAQATSSLRPVEVHAWVDIACPWCRIAKRRFEEAETAYGGPVALEYHSFELAPELPVDYRSSETEFLQFLYAGTTRAEAEQMMWVVRGTGARLGLVYDFDRVQHTSTFLAHQLLHHAKADGRQVPMLDVLFSAFFERGRDLRRIDELVALAGEVHLDSADTRTALETGRYAEAVRADRELAAAYGVGKIPTYVVAGHPPIHGAKRPAVLVDALRTAGETRGADGETSSAS